MAHKFHVLIDLTRVGCGGGHNKMILCHASGGAIIHGDTVLAQHQAIAGFVHGQFGKAVAVDLVEKISSISTLHVDLAQSGAITDSD